MDKIKIRLKDGIKEVTLDEALQEFTGLFKDNTFKIWLSKYTSEELAQWVRITIFKTFKLNKYDYSKSYFTTYIISATINNLKNDTRTTNTLKRGSDKTIMSLNRINDEFNEMEIPIPDKSVNIPKEVILKILREEIESSLAKLKPIDRKFYNDYFIKNYTFDEIAALENVSQPAISRRYKRFKQRMSIEFKKRHIDEKYLENLEVYN